LYSIFSVRLSLTSWATYATSGPQLALKTFTMMMSRISSSNYFSS